MARILLLFVAGAVTAAACLASRRLGARQPRGAGRPELQNWEGEGGNVPAANPALAPETKSASPQVKDAAAPAGT